MATNESIFLYDENIFISQNSFSFYLCLLLVTLAILSLLSDNEIPYKSGLSCSPVLDGECEKKIKILPTKLNLQEVPKQVLEQTKKEERRYEFSCIGVIKIFFAENISTLDHYSSLGMVSSLSYFKQTKIFGKLDKRQYLLNQFKINDSFKNTGAQKMELDKIKRQRITEFLEQKFNNVSLNNCETRIIKCDSKQDTRAFVMTVDFQATVDSNLFEAQLDILKDIVFNRVNYGSAFCNNFNNVKLFSRFYDRMNFRIRKMYRPDDRNQLILFNFPSLVGVNSKSIIKSIDYDMMFNTYKIDHLMQPNYDDYIIGLLLTNKIKQDRMPSSVASFSKPINELAPLQDFNSFSSSTTF
jgi:hypothetical protein